MRTRRHACDLSRLRCTKSPPTDARLPRHQNSCAAPDDRLPDAAQRQAHLRDVFYRMGFNDQEIVCLSGAHAIGRCHTDRSGFWGPWTYGENAFSNDYFKFLLEKVREGAGQSAHATHAMAATHTIPATRLCAVDTHGLTCHRCTQKWTPKKTHEGKKWLGPMQYEADGGALVRACIPPPAATLRAASADPLLYPYPRSLPIPGPYLPQVPTSHHRCRYSRPW